MSGLPRTGVWIFPSAPAADLVDAVVLAEELGLDDVWVADEGVMREPSVVLAAAAVRTTTVRLGVGITSPLLRHPGALASTWLTLDELSGGRAMLGLGIGGGLSLDPLGIRVERPVAVLRDALRTVRAVAARSPGEGYHPPDHAAPARALSIYVGAKGEQLNRLASREADGVFVSGVPLSRVADVVGWARSVREVDVALYPSVRFAGPPSDEVLGGGVESVAAGLVQLAERHRPASLGLCLVDEGDASALVRAAAEALARATRLLSSRG